MDEKWISAGDALNLMTQHMTKEEAEKAILGMARGGALAAKATTLSQETLNQHDHVKEDQELAADFWSLFEDEKGFKANWPAGQFTKVTKIFTWRASGVSFDAAVISDLATSSTAITEDQAPTASHTKRPESGQSKSDKTNEFIAEALLFVDEKGLPPDQNFQKTLYDAVANRLASKGMEAPDISTVRPFIKKTVNRVRTRENLNSDGSDNGSN